MSNNKQSSVEWLMHELINFSKSDQAIFNEVLKQAKAMHKEEIISAVNAVELVNRYYYKSGGFSDDLIGKEISANGWSEREYYGLSTTGEQYYCNTYGG